MKLKLTTECKIHVLDVSMPILRTTVRNDLRLIANLSLNEQDGKVSGRDGEAIREMLDMKPNTWQRIIDEGEVAHGLWRDGQITDKGRQCSIDGMVLDHEDGPHRLWVIDAQEPIGLRIIHIEAWADIEISSKSIGETHTDGFVRKLRKEGAIHQSILDSKNRCRFKPPNWWIRWMKRDPAVQEHPDLSTVGQVSFTWGVNDSTPMFSFSGVLKGKSNGDVSAKGLIDVTRLPVLGDMQDLVSEIVSGLLIGSQTWDVMNNCIRTSISAFAEEKQAIHEMKTDFTLGLVEQRAIGSWERGTLEGVQLRASNQETARDWASALFWTQHIATHRTQKQVAKIIETISNKQALEEFPLTLDLDMNRSLIQSKEAPSGAKWLFDAAIDLTQAIGKEVI